MNTSESDGGGDPAFRCRWGVAPAEFLGQRPGLVLQHPGAEQPDAQPPQVVEAACGRPALESPLAYLLEQQRQHLRTQQGRRQSPAPMHSARQQGLATWPMETVADLRQHGHARNIPEI